MRTPDSNDETEKSVYYPQDMMRARAATILWAALLCLVAAGAYAQEADLTHLPLGDGTISQEPKKGWIWACRIDPDAGARGVTVRAGRRAAFLDAALRAQVRCLRRNRRSELHH
jgi:hypothetical protein